VDSLPSEAVQGVVNHKASRDGHPKLTAYSAFHLLRYGLSRSDWPPAWQALDLSRSYDVVIVGGGVHGLATVYYLAVDHVIDNARSEFGIGIDSLGVDQT
jgi:sarcosine oxidase, subunit beta